jgi:hypothetical protein
MTYWRSSVICRVCKRTIYNERGFWYSTTKRGAPIFACRETRKGWELHQPVDLEFVVRTLVEVVKDPH